MAHTDEEILKTFRGLMPHTFIHTDGFTCFPQMTIEFQGIDPESAENWVLANGGHLKHVRIPEHIERPTTGQITAPDMEPCYFVPDALLQ